MRLKELMTSLPTKIIEEQEVDNQIEKFSKIYNNGESFVSMLSINRFLPKPLVDFSIEERLSMFKVLKSFGFRIELNGLYRSLGEEIEKDISHIVTESFNMNDMNTLDYHYMKDLLKGNDIMFEKITGVDGYDSVQDIFNMFVLSDGTMGVGDTPTLTTMLVVKKALLGTYVASENLGILKSGKREIYDVSVLF
mgnify:CR=1 FL=1